MKIFSPILKGTTTVAQGTTNLSGSFTGSLLGTAATASYADNFTVGGTLTAQTINVQIITSSIEFNTGSTRNGSSTANTHQFTGSVLVNGSLGIGTSSPSSRLDIAWGGYQTQGGAINIGADIGNLTTRTNNTIKYGIISAVPYTNADKPIELLTYYSNNTEKVLSVGGGGNTDFAGLNSISFLTTSSLTQPGAVRMTITSAGNVGIGTTSPSTQFMVSNNSTSVTTAYIENNGAGYGLAVTTSGNDGTHYIANFRSTGVDRVQILDNGRVLVGGNVWSTERFGVVLDGSLASATGITAYTVNTGYNGSLIRVQAETAPGTGWYGYELRSSGGTLRYGIYGNGSVTAPSDERRKKNIETTRDGYLQDVCNLRVVKYNWNEDEEGKDKELGFVAQEVEQIFPKLVETGYDGLNNENEVKLLKQGVLIPILVKAIQELSAKNTSLEERLTALENN
jgi:hypothetical protein